MSSTANDSSPSLDAVAPTRTTAHSSGLPSHSHSQAPWQRPSKTHPSLVFSSTQNLRGFAYFEPGASSSAVQNLSQVNLQNLLAASAGSSVSEASTSSGCRVPFVKTLYDKLVSALKYLHCLA